MAVFFVRLRWQNEGNAKDKYYHNFTCVIFRSDTTDTTRPAAPQRAKLTTMSKKIQPRISDYIATQVHIREYPRVQ